MTEEVETLVKKEIQRLLDAKFIKIIKYAKWVSNIVPVMKKNGKVRICVYFRNINLATPKDEYLMPVVDLLVDRIAGYEYLSFMDGYSGYNQIQICEEDVDKLFLDAQGQ